MKNIYKSIAILALLLPASMMSSAAEPQKTVEPMQGMGIHHGMGMMGNMTEAQQDEHLRTTQEHMLMMHDLSNQILTEKDAAKKESLKKQQLELMKAHHAQIMEHHKQKMLERKSK